MPCLYGRQKIDATMLKACDCLSYCGDDPLLKDGRCQPCPTVKASLYREQRKREVIPELMALARTTKDPETQKALFDTIKLLTGESLSP
jgi:hypothetical protein